MDWIIQYPLVASIICLLCACAFSTLKSAFQFAGEAGISRLKERFPESESHLDFWELRWPHIVVSLNLITIFLRLGFVTLLLYGSLPFIKAGAQYGIGFLAVATLVVWIFCYLVPLAVGNAFSDRISMRALPIAGLITRVLSPIALPLSFFQKKLLHHLLAGSDSDSRPTAEDEIRSVVDQANIEELEAEERDMIRGIFELGDTVAREIMTPRVDIIGLEDTVTAGEAAVEISATAHSRFPVYTDTMDEVIGTVHIKDLIHILSQSKPDTLLRDMAKPITYVPETMPIQDLLGMMQSQQHQVALVVDEYGGTAGLVTMEDIIEEIVGEIHDEYDSAKHAIQSLHDNAHLVDARINLEELNEQLDFEIPTSEEYDSLAGYVLHALGHIPSTGERIVVGELSLTIKSATPQQIITVQIEKNEPATQSTE